jgi:predicted esterase
MKRSQRHRLFLGFSAGAAASLAAWLVRRGQAARLVLANRVNYPSCFVASNVSIFSISLCAAS